MDKQTKQWIAATKAWIKTQLVNIESCDMRINHSRQEIDLANRSIKLETEEKLLKVNQLKEVRRELAKYK